MSQTVQIVIEMSEENYEQIKGRSAGYINYILPSISDVAAISAIQKGVPLSEVLHEIREELIQDIQNGVIEISSGNEVLFSTLDKHAKVNAYSN